MQKKNIGVPSKKKKKITSSQPGKLIFGIQPYLTQLGKICKNNTNWGAIKKKKKKIIWKTFFWHTTNQPKLT
jgi:hypothetical protein